MWVCVCGWVGVGCYGGGSMTQCDSMWNYVQLLILSDLCCVCKIRGRAPGSFQEFAKSPSLAI